MRSAGANGIVGVCAGLGAGLLGSNGLLVGFKRLPLLYGLGSARLDFAFLLFPILCHDCTEDIPY